MGNADIIQLANGGIQNIAITTLPAPQPYKAYNAEE